MNIGFGREKEEKDSLDIWQAKDDLKETRGLTDVQNQDQEGANNQKANNFVETLQVLDREN